MLLLGALTVALLVVGVRAGHDLQARPQPAAARTSVSTVPRTTAAPVAPTGPENGPEEPRVLFETDEFNIATLCFKGQYKGFDHRENPCRQPMSRMVSFPTSSGGAPLKMWSSRSTWDTDGGYGMHEDVAIFDAKGRAVHTLVQWKSSSTDGETNTLRRRFRFANLSGTGADGELCIESLTEIGPDRFALMDAKKFRPTKRFVGYDAFAWSASRFVRAESLDGQCPKSGYQLFVPLPLTDDVVHQSRGR